MAGTGGFRGTAPLVALRAAVAAMGALAVTAGLTTIVGAPPPPAGAGVTPGVAPANPPAGSRAGGPAASNWTVYHGNLSGTGVDASGTSLSPATPAWTSPTLDGQLYGEPLTMGGRVFVATENDTVYALSATTGGVLWSRHLGEPVPAGDLPCGDISPTVGITGTPVIDPTTGEIFVVADTLTHGGPAHVLVGLDIGTGAVRLTQNVDPPGSTPAAQLQRTGLTLADGLVVFGYGGNGGDCSTYHGWVLGVPEGGGALRTFEVDAGAGQSQGAVWMGGAAPLVDHQGRVWVSAGNGSVHTRSQPYDDSDSVLQLSPSLTLLEHFAPRSWASDNAGDEDLGSAAPALLADGLAVQAGKSQVAYLLDREHLGGIGGQEAQLRSFCGANVDGGEAVSGSVVYAPCGNGVEAVRVTASPPGLTPLWTTPTGSPGPAIVAGGLVWTIDHRSGTLYGLDPATGSALQQFALGPIANHFPTPAVGDHLLLAAAADTVHAFAGPPATIAHR